MFCKICGNNIKEGTTFCTNCGNAVSLSRVKKMKHFILERKIVLSLLLIMTVVIIIYASQYKSPDNRQESIISAVVNIYCNGATDEDTSGGSGTIITKEGLVLTNAHIIPQGEEASTDQNSCLVILPDPTTGSAKEMYYAEPIVIPDISEKYDLAFVSIEDVYYDKEEGKSYGEYPKDFPAYNSELFCKNDNPKLGEPVRIYGYPAISGDGWSLTITDGIVSSLLPKDGYIVTSAKISHGNSGGLAVDKNGCRIGIPSMVTGDDYESLGVIISNRLISDFADEVDAYVKNNK